MHMAGGGGGQRRSHIRREQGSDRDLDLEVEIVSDICPGCRHGAGFKRSHGYSQTHSEKCNQLTRPCDPSTWSELIFFQQITHL